MSDAVCDGTADQTEINAALDAVAAAGGGSVVLSEGTFVINGAITPLSYTNLIGQGRGTIIKIADDVSSSFTAINIATSRTDDYLADFYLDGNGSTVGNFYHNGVSIDATCSDIRFERVKVVDFKRYSGAGGAGFVVSGVNCQLVRCSATANDYYGIYLYTSSALCVLESCYTSGNGGTFSGIIVDGSDHVLNTPIVISENGDGIYISGDRIRINGGIVQQSGGAGVYLNAAEDCVVSNMMIRANGESLDDTYSGIYALDTASCCITGNVVRDGDSPLQQKYGVDGNNGNTALAIFGNDFVASGKTGNINAAIATAVTCPEWIGSDASTNVQNDITKANLN
jgi:parallel beta-helix repeat protein